MILEKGCSLAQDKWIDDIRKWPQLEFGDIYTYLIYKTKLESI